MLNLTIEKGIVMGESPHMILLTNEQNQVPPFAVEDFILDEKIQQETPFIISADQDSIISNDEY
jgi:hypothetical protein